MLQKPRFLALLGALLLLAVAPASSSDLESQVRQVVARSGGEVCVALRTLDGEVELLLDADKRLHAASTMKVPVMVELFRQAEAGELGLDDTMLVDTTFESIVDGSPYELTVGEDSDGQVYSLSEPGRACACSTKR